MTLATLRWCWGSELWSAIREANTPSLWSLVVKQSLKNWEICSPKSRKASTGRQSGVSQSDHLTELSQEVAETCWEHRLGIYVGPALTLKAG